MAHTRRPANEQDYDTIENVRRIRMRSWSGYKRGTIPSILMNLRAMKWMKRLRLERRLGKNKE